MREAREKKKSLIWLPEKKGGKEMIRNRKIKINRNHKINRSNKINGSNKINRSNKINWNNKIIRISR